MQRHTLLAMKFHYKTTISLSGIVQPHNKNFSMNSPIVEKPIYPSTERGPSAAQVGKRSAGGRLI